MCTVIQYLLILFTSPLLLEYPPHTYTFPFRLQKVIFTGWFQQVKSYAMGINNSRSSKEGWVDEDCQCNVREGEVTCYFIKKVDDRAYSEVRAGKGMKIEWPRNFCLFLEGPDGEMSDSQPWSGIQNRPQMHERKQRGHTAVGRKWLCNHFQVWGSDTCAINKLETTAWWRGRKNRILCWAFWASKKPRWKCLASS